MEPKDRLKMVRAERYPNARQAALAMGVSYDTYAQHENGTREVSRNAALRYSRFFRINLDWLLIGKGEMRGRQRSGVALVGKVGAGDARPIAEAVADGPIDWIEMPGEDEIWALEIEGDSASPRYRHGDILLVDRDPVDPDRMLGSYCVLDLADGRRCAKRLQKVRGIYMLASENKEVEIEESPLIIGCYRIRGVIER
jgi:phage repressor protein C with HTH and peptisase S24 domain